MSGVNSKTSPCDLTPPSPKRLKPQDSTSAVARIGMTEQMAPQTSPGSPADRVLRIPDELLSDIFGYLAADSNLEELLNLRLVCTLWKREVYVALKTNPALLPWIVVKGYWDNSKLVQDVLSIIESGNLGALKSLGGCRDNLTPECGLPLQLVVNDWTPELQSFLRDYSSDIVNFWIYGNCKTFHGFPEHLGGVELPSLEKASFWAYSIRNVKEYCDGFIKALAFWKELVKISKNLQTCELNIGIIRGDGLWGQRRLSPDHEVFDQLEWSRVTSLQCSYEFYQEASASKEFSALKKLQCMNTFVREFGGELSLEKVAHLEEMEFCSPFEWRLDHPMKNLKTLTLRNTTIVCEQSPPIFLPNLRNITVYDVGAFTARSSVSSLISGGGEYEVVNLSLTEGWTKLRRQRLRDVAVRLCETFPKLTELEWESKGTRHSFWAAPVIFSRLEFLTRLQLVVISAYGKELVELISGIPYEEVPKEEGSWPTLLDGYPRSITNLKHLLTFAIIQRIQRCYMWTTRRVSMRDTRFLFMAAFRTMPNLKELCFKNITFEDTSSLTDWKQMGRKIEIEDCGHLYSELSGDE